jgi:hypothetical protein
MTMIPERTDGVTPWVGRLLVANLIAYLLKSTLFWAPRFALFGFSPLAGSVRDAGHVSFVHASTAPPSTRGTSISPPVQRLGGQVHWLHIRGIVGATPAARAAIRDQLVVGASGAVSGGGGVRLVHPTPRCGLPSRSCSPPWLVTSRWRSRWRVISAATG